MTRRETVAVAAFVLVAFGVPWGITLLDDETLNLWLFPVFCSIAGFVAAYIEGGVEGVRGFCRRTLRLRGAIGWSFVAVSIPLALGLAYLQGTGVPLSAMRFSGEALMGLSLGAALVTGPLAEEFGWRGYLQNKLLGRMRPIWAALLIGLVWCAWHFPLFRSSVFTSVENALRYFAYLATWSVFMVYLVQRARGSVWPAVFFHWAANVHANVLGALFPSLDGSRLPGGLYKGVFLYLSVAIVFVLLNRRFFMARPTGGTAGIAVGDIAQPKPLQG